MKDLRRRFERFCYQNREKGIPNLMLYVSLGCGLVYLITSITQSPILYNLLVFDRNAILRGQIWRLISYPLTFYNSNVLLMALMLYCYYSLGHAMETLWGTFRFNLFYLTGIVMMDVYCLLFGGHADVTYLNMSLFLSYATMFPDAGFLLFFIIPVKAWLFALVDLALVLYGLIAYPFPYSLFSVISLANYFLFFGRDVLNVVPLSWRIKLSRLFKKGAAPQQPKVVPFAKIEVKKVPSQQAKPSYTHRCTVCGRTDVSHPQLEFRYCSKCNGYFCYCEDHISNHTHVE